jgi:hypothetical protein
LGFLKALKLGFLKSNLNTNKQYIIIIRIGMVYKAKSNHITVYVRIISNTTFKINIPQESTHRPNTNPNTILSRCGIFGNKIKLQR